MCMRMEDLLRWAEAVGEENLALFLREISNSVIPSSLDETVAEFASLDESEDEDELETEDEDELETEDEEEDEEDEEASLPSSLTDLLNVPNTNRILEAA